MNHKLILRLALSVALIPVGVRAQQLQIEQKNNSWEVRIAGDNGATLSAPPEGLWSIATGWEGAWPSDWKNASPTAFQRSGDWEILTGTLDLPEGSWYLQDAYRQENGRVKCIRRFEWRGDRALEKVTLSVRWQVSARKVKAFLPGILYYGNPSGEKNGTDKVVVYHGEPGEAAILEEHRYPMPFACFECEQNGKFHGAVLHTLPSPVPGGNRKDQWWSLGVKSGEGIHELILLSGPVTYNGRKNVIKGLQTRPLPYGDTYTHIEPGTVIEKTFWLEIYGIEARGTAFQRPLYTSIDLFKPFYKEDLPSFQEIIRSKYKFAKSRWIEGKHYAGFNMYPPFEPPRIVMGWAGQCETPGYALQVLADDLNDDRIWEMVQRSLDHICSSPVGKNGFPVIYEVEKNRWKRPDPVSEGQAMNNIALAIREGRKNQKVDVSAWEVFLRRACDINSARILAESWNPINTAEAFYISPLLIASGLYQNEEYKKAALKAADYYAGRHLDMDEPYWGGTLDATCEDKEGAWGAFQGFLASYEYTKNPKYLRWARHAGDVTLSYTVVWDIPLPAGRLADHYLKTRGWTGVSAQNQHLDVYGVLIAPAFYKLGQLTGNEDLQRLAEVMYRSCGQMIDPNGSQGEQLLETNFIQRYRGDVETADNLRGGYSEDWTVFWITAHFLHAAADFELMGVEP